MIIPWLNDNVLAQLRADLEAMRRDAKRYRWWREQKQFMGWSHDYSPKEIDAAVDEAMTLNAKEKHMGKHDEATYPNKARAKAVILPIYNSIPHATHDQIVQQAAFACAVMNHQTGPTYQGENSKQELQVNDFHEGDVPLTTQNVALVQQGPYQWGIGWYAGMPTPAGALSDAEFSAKCTEAGCKGY